MIGQARPTVIVREIAARSILCRSAIGGAEYALNPFVGCAHACVYCYAVFMKRFTNHAEPWGAFVDVKANAADLLLKEMRRRPTARVFMSSVTDAYQPLERRYRLTERCLDVLAGYPFAEVSILTKSDLVLRDLPTLARMPGCSVGMTVTTLDDAVARWVEPGATPPSRRIAALRALGEAGVRTWVFLGPLLPYYSDGEAAIASLLERARAAGASYAYVDRMNFYPSVKQRLLAAYRARSAEALACLQRALRDEAAYAQELRARVQRLAGDCGLEVRGFC